MPYFTTEQIEKAKEIDLLSYLQHHKPEELAFDSRNSYKTVSHDSLKISNGMWYWFSRGIGGKTALEYLIQVEGYSFTDAVSHLIKQKGIEKVVRKNYLTEEEKIKRLILPQKSYSNSKIISYLKGRGISKNIIDECINKDLIYQDYPKNNVVFVGYDENNNPRYGGVRGANSSRYMHECYGSDKAYSFKLTSIIPNNEVHLFESAIDLLSYATILKKENKEWQNENLISLAGVYQPAKNLEDSKVPLALNLYLNNNPNINRIVLHLDNDEAGIIATQAIINKLKNRYEILNDPPKIGKDFNDYLQKQYCKKKEKER